MDARQLSSNASAFSVGMMKLTRGGFSEPDGMRPLWLTAPANSNQLCIGSPILCVRIAMQPDQKKRAEGQSGGNGHRLQQRGG